MQAEANYISIHDAKEIVLNLLDQYGKQRYSRLLLNTHLPETVLDKAVELLLGENLISRAGDDDDPTYTLVNRSLNTLKLRFGNLIGIGK